MMHLWRKFKRNALLNALTLGGNGLAFGAILLLFSYLYQEYRFEDFHALRDRIYRPTYVASGSNFTTHWARIPVNYINQLPEEIPEIKALIRFQNQEQKYFRIGEQRFKPDHAFVTDANVFDVFTFPLIAGDKSEALKQPHTMVVTEREALRLFGHKDAVGEQVMVSGDWSPEETAYTVTGVMRDVPGNTHLPVTEFLSFDDPQDRSGWAYVYVLLQPEASIDEVMAKMPAFIERHTQTDGGTRESFIFQPLESIHLSSHLAREIVTNGSSIYLRIFWSVGLFIWLIVLVNDSNFKLATTISRGRELGVRKVLGARRMQLAGQLFVESLLQMMVCTFIGFGLAYLALPALQQITGRFSLAPVKALLPFLTALIGVTALLVSLVPMLLTRTFQVIRAIRNGAVWTAGSRERKFNLRKVLITIQFSAALILVATTLITYRQFQFIRQADLGLQPDQILTISNVPDAVVQKYSVYRDRLRNIPGVLDVSACMQVPSEEIRDSGPVLLKGTNQNPEQAPRMDIQIVDGDFFRMMEMEFLAGNDSVLQRPLHPYPQFDDDLTPAKYLREQRRSYVVNETALHQLGFKYPEDALGREINFAIGGFELAYGPITGVIRDYHQESMRNKIDPLVLVVEPIWLQTFLIKVRPDQLDQTMAGIESSWNDLFPYRLEYHFLDELFEQLYRQDRLQITLLAVLALLTLMISFIGSISLLMYSLRRREKELAIRRVVGAGQSQLYGLISREYVTLLLISSLIGIPVSWYGAKQWMANFAYHTTINPLIYLVTLLFTLTILLGLVWMVSHRTTRRNPVVFLRED